jgi:hypothetical protein
VELQRCGVSYRPLPVSYDEQTENIHLQEFVAGTGKLLLEGNVVKAHGGMSINNEERMILNMNAHKNKRGEAKSTCRIKKRVHQMESSDYIQEED